MASITPPNMDEIKDAGKAVNEAASDAATGVDSLSSSALTLATVVSDISTLLNNLSRNPVLSSYTFHKINDMLSRHVIAKLKETGQHTDELEKKIVKTVHTSNTWITTLSFVAAGLHNVANAQTKVIRNSADMAQYMSLSQLPGGASSMVRGAAEVQFMTADMRSKYTDELSKIFQQQALTILPQLSGTGTLKQLGEMMAVYSRYSDVNVAGTATSMLDRYRGSGLSPEMAIQMVTRVIDAQMSKQVSFGTSGEALNAYLRLFQQQMALTGNNIGQSYQQAFTTMLTLGKDFGLGEMQQLQGLIPKPGEQFATNLKRGALLPGITAGQLTAAYGSASPVSETARLLQEGVRNLLRQNLPGMKGATNEEIRNIDLTRAGNTSGLMVIEKLANAMNIPSEALLGLARMKDIPKGVEKFGDTVKELTKSSTDLISEVNQSSLFQQMQKNLDMQTSAADEIGAVLQKGQTELGTRMTEEGIEGKYLNYLGYALSIMALLGGGSKILKYGKTKLPNLFGGKTTGNIGADILRETPTSGSSGGIGGAITDFGINALIMKLIQGGSKTGGAAAGGAGLIGKLGRFGGYGALIAALGYSTYEGTKMLLDNAEKKAEDGDIEGANSIFNMMGSGGLKHPTTNFSGPYKSRDKNKVLKPPQGSRQDGTLSVEAMAPVAGLDDSEGIQGIVQVILMTSDGKVLGETNVKNRETKQLLVNLKGVLG